MLTLQTEHAPIFGLSATDLLSVKFGILTLGAGDITLAGPMLADLIDQRHHV